MKCILFWQNSYCSFVTNVLLYNEFQMSLISKIMTLTYMYVLYLGICLVYNRYIWVHLQYITKYRFHFRLSFCFCFSKIKKVTAHLSEYDKLLIFFERQLFLSILQKKRHFHSHALVLTSKSLYYMVCVYI